MIYFLIMKEKILYIGTEIINPTNGGDMIDYRNQSLLRMAFGNCIIYVEPDIESKSIESRLTMGLTSRVKNEINIAFANNSIVCVFVSQSYYGAYTNFIKRKYITTIITFCHNVESNFFRDSLKVTGFSLRGWIYAKKIECYERMSLKLSDKIITLNQRDSMFMKKYYNRKADYILPTTFEDEFDAKGRLCDVAMDIDYLFLGSSFFPNVEGCQWFLKNVFPQLSGKLCIAGRGMDKVDFEVKSPRLEILGFIPDLSTIYKRAKVVISPIFSGSGMKTKTAEALMYGKVIVGTKEAFEGYIINSKCMFQCDTADDFIRTLNELLPQIKENVCEESRAHFKNNYDNDCVVKSFKKFIIQTVDYQSADYIKGNNSCF